MNAAATAPAPAPAVPLSWDRPRYDVVLLGAVLALVAIGIVMVYSSSVEPAKKLHDGFYFLKRQIVFAALGTILMERMMRMGYERLRHLAYPLLIVCGVLVVATLIPGIGVRSHGAQRWIRLPGTQVQPTEMLKVALCIYLAKSVSEKDGEALRDFRIGLLPHFIVLGVLAGIVIAQPDFGTVMVMAAVTIAVLFVAGARLTYVFVAGGALVPVAYLLITHSEYRMRRIHAFLDPFADRWGKGYQVAEALMSVGSGGLTGLGLGEGKQKLGYLPEGHTDYILASVGEELGLLGIAFVLALYAVIVVRGMKAAREAPDPFGAYLAFGITALFAIETVINSGMCLGLLPSKGLALPFMSYGGTSLVKAMMAAGILLSISGGGGGYLKPAEGATRCA